MRTDGQIRHRLKQFLYRTRQKRLKAALRCRPETCRFNREIEGELRVCGHPDQPDVVCDRRYGGVVRAKECALWEPLRTKEEIDLQFEDDYGRMIQCARKGEIDPNMVAASVLMWVLGEDDLEVPPPLPIDDAFEWWDGLTLIVPPSLNWPILPVWSL